MRIFWGISCIITTVFFFVSCGEGEEEEPLPIRQQLIGSWESSSVALEFTIGTTSLYDHFVNEYGFTEEEAEEAIQFYGNAFAQGLSGILVFNGDGTFSSTLGSSMETGTWRYVNYRLVLTQQGTNSTFELIVVSVDSAILVIGFDQTQQEDFNADGINEEIEIEVELTLNKTA